MKKNLQIIGLLLFSALVIGIAIYAGDKHDNCRECPLALRSK